MNPQITEFLGRADRFSAVLSGVPGESAWNASSPCDGWTAADVLDHVVDTQRDALTGRGLDVGERPTGNRVDVWSSHLANLRTLLADDDAVGTEYDGYFGPTTLAHNLALFYGFDLIVHRWDIGVATGQDVTFSEEEMSTAEQAADGFGDALHMEGICKSAVEISADAPRQDRLLARLGRQV